MRRWFPAPVVEKTDGAHERRPCSSRAHGELMRALETRLWRYTWTFGRSRPQASSAATSRRDRSRSRGIGTAVERMEIGEEDVHVPAGVDGKIRQRPDRADVVAEVQIAGRLDPGQGDGRAGRGRAAGTS